MQCNPLSSSFTQPCSLSQPSQSTPVQPCFLSTQYHRLHPAASACSSDAAGAGTAARRPTLFSSPLSRTRYLLSAAPFTILLFCIQAAGSDHVGEVRVRGQSLFVSGQDAARRPVAVLAVLVGGLGWPQAMCIVRPMCVLPPTILLAPITIIGERVAGQPAGLSHYHKPVVGTVGGTRLSTCVSLLSSRGYFRSHEAHSAICLSILDDRSPSVSRLLRLPPNA